MRQKNMGIVIGNFIYGIAIYGIVNGIGVLANWTTWSYVWDVQTLFSKVPLFVMLPLICYFSERYVKTVFVESEFNFDAFNELLTFNRIEQTSQCEQLTIYKMPFIKNLFFMEVHLTHNPLGIEIMAPKRFMKEISGVCCHRIEN